MEILMILLISFLVYPADLHLNRGNHADFMMNLSYMEEKSCKSWNMSIPGSQLAQLLTMKSWSYMVGYQSPRT